MPQLLPLIAVEVKRLYAPQLPELLP
ncbi:MAG: hypothetical protein ACD_57C00250G0001, partial [uncultured bacterium]